MAAIDPARLRQQFADAGQGQVFRFWDRLDASQRERFAAELAEVPAECLLPLPADAPADAETPEPAPAIGEPRTGDDPLGAIV